PGAISTPSPKGVQVTDVDEVVKLVEAGFTQAEAAEIVRDLAKVNDPAPPSQPSESKPDPTPVFREPGTLSHDEIVAEVNKIGAEAKDHHDLLNRLDQFQREH